MTVQRFIPYVNFTGEAAEATALYVTAFGGEVKNLMRFADLPDHQPDPAVDGLVMHSELHVGAAVLYLSDVPPGVSLPRGGSASVMVDLDDVAAVQRAFDTLAPGGAVQMAPHDAFWGVRFALLSDKFGIQWMLSSPLPAA